MAAAVGLRLMRRVQGSDAPEHDKVFNTAILIKYLNQAERFVGFISCVRCVSYGIQHTSIPE